MSADQKITKIAHFSDTHVLSIKGVQLRQLLNKRISGAINLALNRAKHYRVEVFESLLDAVLAVSPDHSLCTGDLVNLALAPEFELVHELLSARFEPDQLTLVPGNHDYYTKEAALAGHFEGTFAEYLPRDLSLDQGRSSYPVTRLLGDDVGVVGLSSAIPTPTFMATGEVGERQLKLAQSAFASEEMKGRFKLLMLHHPLFAEPARRLEHTRRLKDADALLNALDLPGESAPDLVIHGHNHEYKRQALPKTGAPVLQVASASRAGKKRAEFHLYLISEGRLIGVERHIHDPELDIFIPHNEAGERLARPA